MKLSLLGFAIGALAATIATRDTATLAQDVQAAIDAVNDFDATITSYSGQGDNDKVKSKLDAITTALSKGATDAKASASIEQADALSLASPVQDLAKAVQQALTDLSAQKSALASAGAVQDVLSKLQEADKVQKDLVDTVLSKVPPSLAPVASGVIKPAQDQLASTIADFKSAGGGSAASGSSGGSSSPAPAPAAQQGQHASPAASAPAAAAPKSAPAGSPAGYGAPGAGSPSMTSAASNTTGNTPTGTFTPAAYTGAAVHIAGQGSVAAIAVAMLAGLAF
ncbi:hypothetical protein CKM354_001246700 [Cercospora kikuchii]|uniref:Cell wall protein n=1 Tax=Cercospora kikuchii TaxID=84275 RepID=A0A9P3L2P9_9PEZI|nr:uncharacterized protein CKM354_001246700 [Cercospora kikuchii]GIZ49437.1 hypothetical protein CKM354_001246700 [Cercospora kikuchii]